MLVLSVEEETVIEKNQNICKIKFRYFIVPSASMTDSGTNLSPAGPSAKFREYVGTDIAGNLSEGISVCGGERQAKSDYEQL